MTDSVIALFTSRFEILKTIGNTTQNFYKKCDTNKEQKQQLDPSPLTPYVQLGQTKKEVKLAQARCNLSKPTNPENPHKYWVFGTFQSREKE